MTDDPKIGRRGNNLLGEFGECRPKRENDIGCTDTSGEIGLVRGSLIEKFEARALAEAHNVRRRLE